MDLTIVAVYTILPILNNLLNNLLHQQQLRLL